MIIRKIKLEKNKLWPARNPFDVMSSISTSLSQCMAEIINKKAFIFFNSFQTQFKIWKRDVWKADKNSGAW